MDVSRLIVNADDFGYSVAVNRAILRAFDSSLLTSASIMANMPGFDDAVGLIRQHPDLQYKIGVHLNLTEGVSLSRPGDLLMHDHTRPLFRLRRREREAVYAELRMQLERVLAAGIRPSHLDSHHHVHTEWAIAPHVCRLAREYDIHRIRLTRNMGPVSGSARRWYKTFFNHWLSRHRGLADNTDYFGDVGDMNYFLQHCARKPMRDLSFEIMVHPMSDPDGRLVDLDGKDLRGKLSGFTPAGG